MESINGVFLSFLSIVFVEGASALNLYSWKYVWEIFDSKYSAEKHARTLEQEHIEHVKQQYEEYFKTNKYT